MKMQNSRPLTTPAGEVRHDLTDEELARFRPASEVLPAALLATLRSPGRPKAEVTKERITIRLSPDVLSAFRASGSGWQTRMDAALREGGIVFVHCKAGYSRSAAMAGA